MNLFGYYIAWSIILTGAFFIAPMLIASGVMKLIENEVPDMSDEVYLGTEIVIDFFGIIAEIIWLFTLINIGLYIL